MTITFCEDFSSIGTDNEMSLFIWVSLFHPKLYVDEKIFFIWVALEKGFLSFVKKTFMMNEEDILTNW